MWAGGVGCGQDWRCDAHARCGVTLPLTIFVRLGADFNGQGFM